MKNYISVIYQYYPRNLPWGTYGTVDELIVFVSPLLPVFYLLEQHTCQTAEWYIFTKQATSDRTEEVKNAVRKTFHVFGYQEITYQEAS